MLALLFSLVSFSSAYYPPNYPGFSKLPVVKDDSDLVRAINDRRRLNYIQAANVTVSGILPDDTQGAKHQKFYVVTSRGQKALLVYQLECGHEKIPVKIGDKVSMGGEFIYDKGALVHWLHQASSGGRPDGYVEHNGLRYGFDSKPCGPR